MVERLHQSPQQMEDHYNDIVPLYQAAFRGEPWFEVSKCVDNAANGCIGGFSRLEVGEHCNSCNKSTVADAYERAELIDWFRGLAIESKVTWYVERSLGSIAMAMLASRSDAERTANRIITRGEPELGVWVLNTLGADDFGWLHDVFANPAVRARGNLDNFVPALAGMAEQLEVARFVYSTINPKMIRAARKFGSAARVYEANRDVPDRRDFVVIDL